MKFLAAVLSLFLAQEPQPTHELHIFSGANCPPCREFHIDEQSHVALKQRLAKFKVFHYDWDQNQREFQNFQVRRIPTFIVVQPDRAYRRKIGYEGAEKLLEFLR